MEVNERLARLEELVRVRLDAVIDRLDRMNGRMADQEQRLHRHVADHHRDEVREAAWRAQVDERMRRQGEEASVARWRLALLITTVTATANLVLQVVLRLGLGR